MQKSSTQKVIGIIMTYNCASLVEHAFRQLPSGVFDEMIIVDDGSLDANEVRAIAAALGVPFYTHDHLGYGGNIKFGLQKAIERGGEYMVEIHGDGQYDPAYIIPGIEKIRQDYDFVLGSRFTDWRQPLRDKMPLSRYMANIGLSFFDRLILRVPLTEFHTGFRVYSRHLIETIGFENTSDDYLYSFEIIVQAKYHNLKIGEIPIRCDYADDHTSISIKKAAIYSFQTFYILLKYIAARLGLSVKLFNRV